jgi:hypothetical protein
MADRHKARPDGGEGAPTDHRITSTESPSNTLEGRTNPMHATTSPTLSQPRAGGVRFLGAALVIAAAVTAGALIAVNLPAASTGTTAGAKTGADIHSAAWLRAHHRGAVVLQTPAESSLRELRRGEIGALGAPGAAAALQTPAQSTLDYWRAYADQRVLAPKTGASFMGGVPGYVMSQSYLNSITPQSVPAVRDPMSYWNSITLRGGLLPSVKAKASSRCSSPASRRRAFSISWRPAT